MKDNAWFVGFAPQNSPEIVVVALFESGEHGNLAAPIVRDVIKAYFDKKVASGSDQRARDRSPPFQPGVIPPRAAKLRAEGHRRARSATAARRSKNSHGIDVQVHPRHRLAAAADHPGDLGGGCLADLQRDARDEVARCVVEADCLDRRRDCVLLADQPDRLPHAAGSSLL